MPRSRIFTSRGLPYGKGVDAITVTQGELAILIENIKVFGRELVPYIVARTVAVIIIDLLANAQPKVPWDTGELRESGTATLTIDGRDIVVGRGTSGEAIIGQLSAFKKADVGSVANIFGNVSYQKMRDYFDIAIFTHEQLVPMPGAKKRARQPGTGPKYLEIAFNERKKRYEALMKKRLSSRRIAEDIALIGKVQQRRVGRYMVDVVKLAKRAIKTVIK